MSANGTASQRTSFETLTEEEFVSLRSYRERHDPEANEARGVEALDGLPPAELDKISDDDLRSMVSAAAWDLVCYYEVGGQAAYETRYKRPEWPGASSGVTIGIGYDIGQAGAAEFERVWRNKLPASQFERLAKTAGITGQAAALLAAPLKDIEIPWQLAEEIFRLVTVPKYARLVLKSLANASALSPDSFGALFSLVYNRGASFYNPGGRYTEMRRIRDHMRGGAYGKIPAEILSMARLWEGHGLEGLVKRRKAEAKLFEAGLAGGSKKEEAGAAIAALHRADEVLPFPARALKIAPEANENWLELDEWLQTHGDELASRSGAGRAYGKADVKWAPDSQNPEYRHLDGALAGKEFTFTAKDLELIIRANSFSPSRETGVILFGLRGAELLGGTQQINKDALRLRDRRPDHRAFRCVIGAYHIGRQQLSAFAASTVPNANAVYLNWWRHANRGEPYGNLLLSGCYRYRVGTHLGTKIEVPGALRLQEDSEVAVLRSNEDVTYDTLDYFDATVPHDNLHPAFGNDRFSSAGCQTVRGNFDSTHGHTGDWAEFRKNIGLSDSDNGKRFDYVLVTGLDAAIAADCNKQRDAAAATHQRMMRLRYGSQGGYVKAMQTALQRPATGFFDAQDRIALAALQREKLGFSDGIYSPDMDKSLGFDVFSTPEAAARSLTNTKTRLALVIGNGQYPNAPLENPPHDAAAIASRLRDLGFSVTSLIDKTKTEMSEAIGLFVDRLQNHELGIEAGVIFYAGHGVQIDGENYLLPVDCATANSMTLSDSSIALNLIVRQLEKTDKPNVIFLDCCRNNPFPSKTRGIGGLAKLDAPAGLFIAFSTAPGSVALDGGSGPNSPFTRALAEHMPARGISISQMMIRVRRDVFKTTRGQQMPWDSSSLLADFSFNSDEPPSASSIRSPENLAQDKREEEKNKQEEYWQLISQSGSPQLVRSYIAQFPFGRHREEADQKLRSLQWKQRFYRAGITFAGALALLILFVSVQYARFQPMPAADLIGGDIALDISDKIPDYLCKLRCIFSRSCIAYSHSNDKEGLGYCYIKNDFLFFEPRMRNDNNSAVLWGYGKPRKAPFKLYWDEFYEGPGITASGELARQPRKNDDNYNAWGEQVKLEDKDDFRNEGVICQKRCADQPKCAAFTYNALYKRCKLFGSVPARHQIDAWKGPLTAESIAKCDARNIQLGNPPLTPCVDKMDLKVSNVITGIKEEASNGSD